MSVFSEIARHIGRGAAAAAPRPERFSVTRVSPLVLDGLETHIRLEDGDDDFESSALRGVDVTVGDVVLVQPEPDVTDPHQVAMWTVVTVLDGAGV